MNPVFKNINEETYKKVKSVICSSFESCQNENIAHCLEALKLTSPDKTLSVRYYKSKKLMLQGKFKGFDKLLITIQKEVNINPKEPLEKKSNTIINKDILIGLDESGRGETFGSMFVCGVKIKSENLEYIKNIVNGKNIKKLNKIQIEGLSNILKGKFTYEIISVPAKEIDLYPINLLLDKKYTLIIKNLSNNPPKESIIIDDYGLGTGLKNILKKFSGSMIIIKEDADMKYTATALASIVARKARFTEMGRLSSENIIIDPESGKKVFFQSGSPSNPETKEYLVSYRKLFPYSDFPIFVRKKWKNVQEVERRFPKKKNNICFQCDSCKNEIYKICIYFCHTDKKTKCFCSLCGNQITPKEIEGFFSRNPIVMDTSALISRIVSKDLATSNYLVNCGFIIPSVAYEEMDSKQPFKKKGGTNEIQYLRQNHKIGLINLQRFEVEDYSDVANDKKFLRVIKAKNGIMLTQDGNLAGFSSIGNFVIYVVDNKESYMKNIEKSK